MKTVGIFEAKTTLSALIESVVAGETIVLTRKGVPVARIVPMNVEEPREFGVARHLFESGEIMISGDFDAPLPPEMLQKLHGK